MQAELAALAAEAAAASGQHETAAHVPTDKMVKKAKKKKKSNKKKKKKKKSKSKVPDQAPAHERPNAGAGNGIATQGSAPRATTAVREAKPSAAKHVRFGAPEPTTDQYDDGGDTDTKSSGGDASSTSKLLGSSNAESALWYDNTPPTLGDRKARVSFETGKKIEDKAQRLWDAEIAAYADRKAGSRTSDSKWLRTVMRNGTLSDRVAAMSMIVQESPLHNFGTLAGLVAMVKKKGSREAHLAVEAIKDLFVSTLLPSRKLLLFHNHPLGSDSITDAHLIYWKFEATLKEKFAEFIQGLEEGMQDTLPYFKRSCLRATFELLNEKPEQEQRLLSNLVNKVGDPDRKIAAQVVFLLQQLIRAHPGMKANVIEDLQVLMFRPNMTRRAIYYSLVFMTEVPLERDTDEELARSMVSLYLRVFEQLSSVSSRAEGKGEGSTALGSTLAGQRKKQKGRGKKRSNMKFKKKKNGKPGKDGAQQEIQSAENKILRVLLQGVNRAFPYAKCSGEETAKMTDALFRLVHTSSLATSIQALMLLLHVMLARKVLSARYYRALYAKLLDDELRTSSKHTIFLNLLYKSMKSDTEGTRVIAFAKRILQVAIGMTPAFACGVMFLLSEVGKVQPALRTMLDGSKEPAAPETETRYDPTKRDPLYSNAGHCDLWELSTFSGHFHPSVRHFAQSLLNSPHTISYNGDPLLDFANPAFLERFSYRNPKKKDLRAIHRQSGVGGGSSAMRPVTAGKYGRTSVEKPVNEVDFSRREEKNVRADEVFFYRYFRQRAARDARIGVDRKASSQDEQEQLAAANAQLQDESEDEDVERFAQQLAESIMRDEATAGGMSDAEDDDDPDFDFTSSDDSDADDDEAAAMAEMERSLGGAGGAGSAGGRAADSNGSGSDDDDDDDDDMAGTAQTGQSGGKSSSGPRSTFAAAEEFADILDSSAPSSGDKRQLAWERRNDWKRRSGGGRKKRRKR